MIYPDASTIIPEFHDIYIYTYYIYIYIIYIYVILYIYIILYIYSHCLVVKTHQNWWWGLSKTPIQNLRSVRALLSISKDCRNFAESCNRERTSRWMDSKHSLDRSGSGSFDTRENTHSGWLTVANTLIVEIFQCLWLNLFEFPVVFDGLNSPLLVESSSNYRFWGLKVLCKLTNCDLNWYECSLQLQRIQKSWVSLKHLNYWRKTN